MHDSQRKKLLIVLTKAPYGSSAIQEALDIVLAAGTFDQDVSLLITLDACYLLLPSQEPGLIQQKNSAKILNALPIYGIEKIFVNGKDATRRGLKSETISLPAHFMNQTEIADLYAQADTVFRF